MMYMIVNVFFRITVLMKRNVYLIVQSTEPFETELNEYNRTIVQKDLRVGTCMPYMLVED